MKSTSSWGSLGASIPMCMAWYPAESEALVVGRQDGVVDIISSKGKSHHHRLLRLTSSPVRAVSFSGDGSLLVAGNDAGMICVWDISGNRKSQPTLVHHIVQAHKSWILGLCFFSDHRRFVSIGAERQIHIWNVGQLSQPVHTFQLDSSVWTVSLLPPNNRHSSDEQAPRLITGSDDGLIQIFSIAKQ
jgi:WD40 repeat protein